MNSATVASEGTVSTSVSRAEVTGRVNRRSRWPRRTECWYSATDDFPATNWLTAAATNAGTTKDPPVDSATNITADMGAR